MSLSLIDVLILLSIFSIAAYYFVVRYREEKKKEKINYIPMLLSYLKKYEEEKEEFQSRAQNFKTKMEEAQKRINQIKEKLKDYRWKKSDIEKLKKLKGTEFETYFSGIFEIMGYQITEPAIYKDCNIDYILMPEKKRICIDFIDYTKIKKINDKYINTLLQGKDKYNCESVWVITNAKVDDQIKEKLFKADINLISLDEILAIFPSIRIFDDYFDIKTVYHNYELLYKETYDEVLRRNEWIDEIQRKLEEAKKDKR